MSGIVDNLIAARIVYLLITPFKDWEACKEGFIGADGERTDKQGDSTNWTMLHRLVWRLKLLLGKIPGGKTNVASLTAAYLLVREYHEHNKTEESITEGELNALQEKVSFKDYSLVRSLLEDAPANVTANVAATGDDPTVAVRVKKKRKKKVGVI